MKQDVTKLLVYEIENLSLPLQFSFLLPSWVSSVQGYELFFYSSNKRIGKDKMVTQSIELSITIDNFGKHVVHDIVELAGSRVYVEPTKFEPNCIKRITGFLHSLNREKEDLDIKLFLIVLKKNE